MSLESTWSDKIGTWEVDVPGKKFVRKDAEGAANGEVTFDYVAETDTPQWFKDHVAANTPAVEETPAE
jgi:hypothetical protein